MQTESKSHPAKDQLIAFGQGKLAAEESSSVEQHLEVCRECCETLLDMKDDTFIGLVKIAQPSDAVADASRVRTELASDERRVGHDSTHSATMLVQSGEAVSVDDLPTELQDHPRYRIVELIGRGGMGIVYRAEHRLMNRPVALKLINSQLIRQPNAVERFRREVQAAAKLTHPNIVTAYDAEQAGDVHFLVMEFVEGTDLASVVKHRGPMSVAEACECIRQVAEGLQHAHEKGMVHRDIKPHNLMLSAEGQVRILDFGLAGFVTESAFESSPVAPRQESRMSNAADLRDPLSDTNPDATRDRLSCRGATGLLSHLTTAGSVMGTPDYIAPEQAKDAHSADIRADIYSLGCTLHFLLTGKPPFVSDNLIAKLKAHADQVPESLTKLRDDVPQELSNVVARMMAKKPAERFQTPAAVAEALAPFAKPAASPPKRRARTLVAALCMGVVALLAGVIFVQTSKGRVEIQSEVDGVKVVIKQGGEQIDVIDITTGSQVTRLPSGEYELKLNGDRNDVEIKGGNFKLSRWGKVIVTLNRKPDANELATAWMAGRLKVASLQKFDAKEPTITQDGVTAVDGAWKIDATENRTARLFEVPNPGLEECVVLYRAKLKTENVKGRAFLEMWVRTPGGESFSEGFQNAVTGTTGWSEYEIPFILQKDQRSDLVKLNVTIEGRGTVWIKDVELAKASASAQSTDKPNWNGWAKDAPPPAIAPFNAEEAKQHQAAWAKHLGVPVEYTNSIGMKFRLIPPGEFTMGSTPKEIEDGLKITGDLPSHQDYLRSEGPQHKVVLTQPFFLGIHEVTQEQYQKVTGLNPSEFTPTGPRRESVVGLDTNRFPVDTVSWFDAADFCVKLSQQESLKPPYIRNGQTVVRVEGDGYRLPTEAQWEFACRAGTTTRFWIGDNDADLPQVAWLGNRNGYRSNTVGVLRANPLGLFDVHGNNWEWTQDEWSPTYYEQLQGKPANDPLGPHTTDGQRVIRGGVWHLDAPTCRSAYRFAYPPAHRFGAIGFRVAVPLETVRQSNQQPSKTPPADSPFSSLRDDIAVAAYLNDPRNNADGSVPVVLLGRNGIVAIRFGKWLVAFEDILCESTAGILGSFNIPRRGARDEATVVFATGKKLPAVFVKLKLDGDLNVVSINQYRFKVRGKATQLEFDDKAYEATNSLQTILVARDGSTKLEMTKGDQSGVASFGGHNLITDPSFENTGLTQLPSGWRAWLNDGPEFRCEVVADGHTGQRCLRISGKGTRGVVFGNDLKADRTKRYALKGWAKFEGDKDAQAVIKFNYFRGSEFLGVHDLVGVTADQPGWHLFEKTDALDAYPQADHFYAMCHVEGSGTGWFDDLELVAYDRDKLPNDFDVRHGRHNRLHGPNSLNRWIGLWETQYVFRETDNSPTETKLTMNTPVERTLGGYFVMSHDSADAARKPTPSDATKTAAIGGNERLLFHTFDQNLGTFRQWMFGSNGKVFEWRGPWNDATKTLELRMLPDASNLFSAERFVDAEHIEGTMWQQFVMGRRDAGRWTATRKATVAKVDLPVAKTHVAEPAELSQLNKFAGEWTIRARYKPSVWNPQPREETARESSVWILGGRFLITRAFNEKDELTSIWIATYDPTEKTNRFWFFNADSSSSESRLTWDAAASGFHFRAIDMPNGWSVTGFNHWIDADSFANTAMIKDENGRVLLDMSQERRRKK